MNAGSDTDHRAPDRLLSVEEVAEYLQMSKSYVYRNGRELGAYKLGRELRFRREHVDRWLRQHRA